MSEDKKQIKSVVVSRLKNGYLVAPSSARYPDFDTCSFVEGFDTEKLAREIKKVFLDMEAEE